MDIEKTLKRKKKVYNEIQHGNHLHDKIRLLIYFLFSCIIPWGISMKHKILHDFMNYLVKGIKVDHMNYVWEIGHYRDFVSINQSYEEDISEWFDYSGDVFLDIGAYIGRYSIILSPRFNRVYAFEPARETNQRLNKNIWLNNIPNIIQCMVALLDEDREMMLNIKYSPGTNSLDNTVNFLRHSKIKAVRLDSFHIYGKIDLIKIDVEGAEKEVLKGGKQTIMKHNPRLIIEVKNSNLGFVNDYIKSIKYRELQVKGIYHLYESRREIETGKN